MITPKEDKRKLLYLRGVRGKHSAGRNFLQKYSALNSEEFIILRWSVITL